MKNILKKLGIFGLLIAILSPFVELPVKAATTNCKNYLQNYLFLGIQNGSLTDWNTFINGYKTYTSFIYSFPNVESDETISIDSISFNALNSKEELTTFYNRYVELKNDEDMSMDSKKSFGNFIDLNGNTVNFDVDQVTYLLHGKWARVNENAQQVDYEMNKILFGGTSAEEFIDSTIQGALINSGKKAYLDDYYVDFGGASFVSNSQNANLFETASGYSSKSKLLDYFKDIVTDVNSGSNTAPSYTNDYIWSANVEGISRDYLNLYIERRVGEETFLSNMVFGVSALEGEDLVYYALSTSATGIVDSYNAYKIRSNDINNKCSETVTEGCYHLIKVDNPKEQITFFATTYDETTKPTEYAKAFPVQKYGLYHPYVLGVKYSVCSNETEVQNWTLTYDANTDDGNVTGTPKDQTTTVGNELVVANGPKSDIYKFVKWCTEKDGTGTCYQADEKIKSSVATTVTLYAQWTEKGTTDNKDTGIETYLLTFVAVGVIAGSVYLVVKKKNVFNQI